MTFAWHWKNKPRKLATITYNGEPFQTVHTGVFGNPPRLPNSPDEWPELEARFAKKFAADILSRRDYPTAQLRQKLVERAVSKEATESALESLGKYIDDERWAEHFVRYEIGKNHGPRLIAQKLKAKGVEPTDELLAPAYDSQEAHIQKLLDGPLKSRSPDRQAAALLRRGYQPEIILSLRD